MDSFNLKQFLILLLSFLILAIVNIIDLLFCTVPIYLYLFDNESWLDSGYTFYFYFFGRNSREWTLYSHCILLDGTEFCLIAGDVNLDPLIKMLSGSS